MFFIVLTKLAIILTCSAEPIKPMIIAAIFFISTKGGMIMLGKDFENIIGCKTLIAVNKIKK